MRVRAQDNWLKLASEFIIFSTIMVALTQHTGTVHQDVFDDVLMVLYAGLLPICTAATVACKVRRSRDDGAHVSLDVRKKQCVELAAVVGRSLERERDEASAQEEAQRLAGLLHGADVGAALARYGNGMLDDAGRGLLRRYLGTTRKAAQEQRQRWEKRTEPVRISEPAQVARCRRLLRSYSRGPRA